MPLCTGGSLQEYVFENRITVGQLVYILRSLVSGLHEIHRHGYIHRDIKCDNIFLTQETNEIVIGDFGVVSIQPTADSAAEEAGVVLFWAPESVQGRIIDSKVDIWALGIVIMEILNGGKAPYEDEECSEDQIKEIILQVGRPHYPPSLPPMLMDFMDRCLEVDPRRRASTEELLKHPFLTESQAEYLFPSYPLHENNVDYSEQVEEKNAAYVEPAAAIDDIPLEKAAHSIPVNDETFLPDFDEAEMIRIQNRLESLQVLTKNDASGSTHGVNPDVIIPDTSSPNVKSNNTPTVPLSDSTVPMTSNTNDTARLPDQLERKRIRRQRSYLPRSSILLCKVETVQGDTSHRIHELQKLHPVQQAYDVFQRRTHMYRNYRMQGSRLPLFIAAVEPKEQLPSIKPPQNKELKRVKSMVAPKKEECSTVKVRRAFSVASFKEKEEVERTATRTRTEQKRISQPVARNSTVIDRRRKVETHSHPPLEKAGRKPIPPPTIDARPGKQTSSAERKDDTRARRSNRNETMAKLMKQEASLRFNDRRPRIKA
ncbi:hypothetical protein Unana1_06780 [Umbelopsis nana]